MHLKALTLRGFKSFASATTLRFEPGITCVVGPNGSGKSNVVDALSWVMGEQGAKSLRGGKMEDVIFAGTTGRPPLGRAEVSLTIDNSDGALPIEYTEVTITRTMFRNGGSEYRINGDTCRLLDIQELLSDSGIGREMHVIVGQGQLDSVLHADPSGRRAFIEEAAGVLKHRRRKEKALRKLDAMQANLARVQDLADELRRQLKPLGRQAAVARKAAVIQAELRDARLRLLADDLVQLREALQAEIADEAALKQRKDAAEAELNKALQHEARLEEETRRLAPRVQRAQQTWYELSRLAERVRGTVSLADARVHSATTQPVEERRGRDPEDLEREAARIRDQEAELEAALEAARRALEDTVAHRAELERELAAEERRLKDVARAIADRREGLARLGAQVSAARSRAASAQAEIDRLATARDEAQERATRAQEEYEALRAEVDGAEEDEDALAAQHETAKAALAEAEDALATAREAAADAERRRAATQARHDALALNLRRKDGTGALLEAKDRLAGLLGPAARLLTTAPGHETALAAALGAAADAVVVATPAAAADALRLLRDQDAGRATLLVSAAPEPAAAPPTPPLAHPFAADLVQGPAELMPAVRRLLHGIVVVDTLEEAEKLVAAHPHLTAVTAEGDLFAAHLAQGGSAGAPSLLQVQAAVDEAAAQLADLEVRCAGLTEARQRAEERRAQCAALVEELGERRRAADRERSAVAQQLGRLAGQARGAAGEAERAAAAAARAQETLDAALAEAEELAERLAAAQEAPVEEEPDTSVRDRLAADGANARQTEMEARLQVRTHEERVKALAGRADALDRAARAEREARARAEQRHARLRHEAAVARAVAAGARQLLAHIEVSVARAEQERVAAEAAKERAEQELAAARTAARDLKTELDKLTDSVHRGEVLGAEKRLRIEQLETKALEELGVQPSVLVEEYGPHQPVPPSPPADGQAAPDDPDDPRNRPRPFVRAEQEKRLKAAERAYQQLGKVNPLALEEFAALEERHRFLSEQLEDLKKTRADLLRVVKEVDERVEQVFTEAFRDTAREFEGVFSRLFPGGEGRLVLTDPDHMLTTGVDVEARPPGKKVKRLSLLSGGERSLTAVALLVSIFKARPSPFYVMDEVEAALDDTNLQRLIGIMRELQETSQLIVITHQKRTMEVADALYGVSMQGDGVSKVISQRLR
ncbi:MULTISPECIES: chromosome segregation protein SMC [Streptomyces]|uniref:Chromosome partition protein Smc n=1 Tax=Streptomyces thermoviolaceus subsp. thermoviolaceus TaxID=66860 RepID=A0ABX0YQF4_STRTL|nr:MULTISPECIES: chromosome segregation protein SMC [Streptomyces]WTD47255.1 chromosome segregation protein SMC [Streptomyces thermoviolaceus]NJP14227.1 chromosome segregation protein SMC [Streptomyces thermoviolaceus subsp. thermoviolaceus]RSR99434.1 chromosome segregation protein SMC [Streptomyces sp. WAC00469]GGV79528.1 chromosome partition protein Smc [Streptomyces thermoviolaceus subsp. apingens]GHA92003.1 chromosome partition protein Smc [Streptomyces thermoviolaceus subsp. thermoviolace